MADFTGTTAVHAPAQDLFDFLSDVGNLPRYFDRLTSAQAGQGEEVHTTATLHDGTKVEGTAWFRIDADDHHIAWGSEGENDYHGYLDVRGREVGSEVEVHIHTQRVEDHDEFVRDSIDKTLNSIKLLMEKQHVG